MVVKGKIFIAALVGFSFVALAAFAFLVAKPIFANVLYNVGMCHGPPNCYNISGSKNSWSSPSHSSDYQPGSYVHFSSNYSVSITGFFASFTPKRLIMQQVWLGFGDASHTYPGLDQVTTKPNSNSYSVNVDRSVQIPLSWQSPPSYDVKAAVSFFFDYDECGMHAPGVMPCDLIWTPLRDFGWYEHIDVLAPSVQHYACSGSSCVANSNGPYTSSNCNNECSAPTRYSCSNGSCYQDSSGPYTSLSQCQQNCAPPQCTPTPPTAATLLSPPNGAQNQPLSLTLDWNPPSSWGRNCAGNTNVYGVEFGTTPSPGLVVNLPESQSYYPLSGLAPNTTYYWRIETTNSSMNARTPVWSFRTGVPTDFSISISPSSQSVEQGQSANYTVSVTSINGFSGPVNLSTNNLTGSGITQTIASSINVQSGLTTITPLQVQTSSTTPVNTYTLTVTGQGGGTIIHSANASLGVSVPIPKPWIKVEGGDVGAMGNISPIQRDITNPSAGAGQFNSQYLVLSQGSIDLKFRSAKSWLVGSYSFNSTPPSYADLVRKYKPSSFAGSAIPNGGKNQLTGNLTIDATNQGSGSEPTVLFVSGDLTLSANVTIARPILFIVGGNITINSGVTSVNGFYIVPNAAPNGIFSTGVSNQQLVVNGGVIARSFNLGRDLGAANQNTPAERFVYNPSYLWYFRDALGTEHTTFKEIVP